MYTYMNKLMHTHACLSSAYIDKTLQTVRSCISTRLLLVLLLLLLPLLPTTTRSRVDIQLLTVCKVQKQWGLLERATLLLIPSYNIYIYIYIYQESTKYLRSHLSSHQYISAVTSGVIDISQEPPQESSIYIPGVTSRVINISHEASQESSIYLRSHLWSYQYISCVTSGNQYISGVINISQRSPQASSICLRSHLKSHQYISGVTSGVINISQE